MIALAIDDEQLMLYALEKAVRASEDIDEVICFTNCDEVLDWIELNTPDVAFLDINLRGINGIGLAEKITDMHPDCKIVFCTGHEEYAVSAFKIHASGYLLKPISAGDVQREIDVIKGRKTDKGILKAKCFGNSLTSPATAKSSHSNEPKARKCLPTSSTATVRMFHPRKLQLRSGRTAQGKTTAIIFISFCWMCARPLKKQGLWMC